MTTVSRAELEPLNLVVSSLIRKSWIILGITALVGIGTYVATGLGEDADDELTATSRVGITTEAVWPFYDVVLEQGRIFIDEPDFQTRLEAELGFPITDIRTVIPDKLSVFDIDVVADTAEHAVAAADLAARKVVEHDIEELNQDRTDKIAAADKEIAELESRTAALEAEIDMQTAQITDITQQQAQLAEFDPVLEETKYPISAARDSNQFVYNDLVRELASKRSQRTNLEATIEAKPRYQVLRLAELPSETSSTRVPIAIGAALAALLLGAAVVVAVDRRRGSVRSPWQLRHVCGADHTGEVVVAGGQFRGAAALADELHRALEDERRVIGIVDATARGVPLADLAGCLGEHGLTTCFVEQPHEVPGHDISFVDVSSEYQHPDTPRPRSHACDGVVVLVDSRTRIRDASSLIDRSETSPGLLTALLVKSR